MKKLLFLIAIFVLFFSCTTEDNTIITEKSYTGLPHRIEAQNTRTSRANSDAEQHCISFPLIAGQYHNAGTVNVDLIDGEIVISYQSIGDWDVSGIHMDISGCDNLTFPTTKSGNPRIGKFEYKSEHEDGINQVDYFFNEHDLSDQFCVAFHAVVEDGNGNKETAWADGGLDFGGNSWAMYASVNLSDLDCDKNSNGGNDTEE